MNELTAFLQANIIPIYFVYGLAHFVTGLAVALESGRTSQLRLSRALPFLAAFGITHGINEWVEMFSMISAHIPTLVQEPRWAEMIKLGWKALSFYFLFEFGTRLLAQFIPERKLWLRLLPPFAMFVYLVSAVTMYMQAKPAGYPQPGLVSVWTNYVLGVPASIIAIVAMLGQRRAFLKDNMPQFGRDLVGAALMLGWYCLLDQVIDDPAPIFPATVLHADAFLRVVGIPIELFRTVSVTALAFFVIRMMRVFEVEYARRLDGANRARFAAQEEATRELVVMFETCRILGTSLDVNQLINDSLTKMVMLLDPMIAGSVYLYDTTRHVLTLRLCRMRSEQSAFSKPESDAEKRAAQEAFNKSEIAYATEPKTETSFIAVPLVSQGKTIGALSLAHRAAFSNYAVIQTLARQLGIALENAYLYSEVQEKEKLRGQLLERAVSAQEEERKRIARELHDETGQWLTALAVGLGGVEQIVGQNPNLAQKQIGELKTMTMNAIDNLRQFVYDLRPSVLDDMGLVSALRWLVDQYVERTKLRVDFQVSGIKRRLPAQVETVLFRIAQEALNNIGRHARATHAIIRLEFSEASILLCVQDNGKGFVVEQVMGKNPERRSWGLLGMQERVELVGGKFQVESEPGHGTKLRVEVPIV
ncbi:MAG: GAF domain-containing sensor histidine kinase [Chloroflexi bacterium]|nr:GAF domain-containing sensor histidine kinase [Chloroflexota bacterium]